MCVISGRYVSIRWLPRGACVVCVFGFWFSVYTLLCGFDKLVLDLCVFFLYSRDARRDSVARSIQSALAARSAETVN